jgi:hypothetical protein
MIIEYIFFYYKLLYYFIALIIFYFLYSRLKIIKILFIYLRLVNDYDRFIYK